MLSNVLHLQVGLSWSERCPPPPSTVMQQLPQPKVHLHITAEKRGDTLNNWYPGKKEVGKEEIQWDFFYFLHFLSHLSL